MHTKAYDYPKSPKECIREKSTNIRRVVYPVDTSRKVTFPPETTSTEGIDAEAYGGIWKRTTWLVPFPAATVLMIMLVSIVVI